MRIVELDGLPLVVLTFLSADVVSKKKNTYICYKSVCVECRVYDPSGPDSL